MMNYCRVEVGGYICTDVKLKGEPGTDKANLWMLVAVNRSVKDKTTGAYEDKPDFIPVTVFGKTAESCAQYLHKGSAVFVTGRLTINKWMDGDKERKDIQVIGDRVYFLDRKETAGASVQQNNIDAAKVSDEETPF